MSYFEEHYEGFRYPLATEEEPRGFRGAQLGAIHAAAAHFVTRSEPGIITMPTGSGKTAVLIAAAFVLRAKRILIITPSRLVREQIADEVATLGKLREIGAIAENLPSPRVLSVRKRTTSLEMWEAMRDYDVVVATVQSISPEFESVPEPPRDLFDVVLVDEAHHSPARTWKAVLEHFSSAKRLLLTATPFRQDQREIKGRFVFTYDLRQAYQDGIFGEISYKPVTPGEGQSSDVAIARAAEAQLRADQASGYNHVVMVRTDGRKRAEELLAIYQANTTLRLSLITGDKSLRYMRDVIQKLGSGELDGIVCVNMLGEGFNFPNLKIAAIHSPHRSLNVTLQFIGRFARTAGDNLGPATFLAVPSEIEIEAERLYDSQAVWRDLVQNLSAARVHEEAETREILESFTAADRLAPDLADLSLYALEPYFHAKLLQLDRPIDINAEIPFPENLQVVYRSVSEAHNAAIYITREVSLPRWTTDERLSIIQPDLFIFHQDVRTNLLFICSSKRANGMYEQFVETFAFADARPLPLSRLNRALNELTKAEFFNVGMRNRVASNTTESYRIVTGSNADRSVQKSDGRLYHTGHFFGRADDNGELITIGLSSGSKIWSNASAKIPDLIAWFEKLARRISTNQNPVTDSGLDYLSVGEEVEALPPNIVCVDWPGEIYKNPPLVHFTDPDGRTREIPLIDLDLSIEADRSVDGEIVGLVFQSDRDLTYRATYSFNTDRFFEPATPNEPAVNVQVDRDDVPLIDYLNDVMLQFYTADLALLHGYNIYREPAGDVVPFDLRTFEAVNWGGANVEIAREFGAANNGRISVHEHMERLLEASDAVVAYYDHGSGEIADFIAVHREGERLLVKFYHCKGSGGHAPGHRVGDCYEVFGQAVKSVPWARWQKILSNIRRRFNNNLGSHRFVRGDLATLEQILEETPASQIAFEFIAVQPGLLREGLPAGIGNLLASASDYLVRGGFRPLRILGS